MRIRIVALAFWLAAMPHALALTIYRDHGGHLGEYADRAAQLGRTGEPVRILGICNSACTTLLRLPAHQMCVGPRARFGFHRAYEIDARGRWLRDSASGTAALMSFYPPNVKAWLARHGGLTRNLKVMSAAASRLRRCK